MTPIRALVLAALALALWLTAGLAGADEPTEPQTATRLHPGINLIGWVGEPTPVAQLFREIPQLEAVWTWDAEFDEWIVAARNAPEWLGGLGRVTAGMGLRMQLNGDAPVTWDRSTEPTRGLVKLRTGWNLVAWSGADGASIDNVAKGIGWSLRSIRRWDATTQQWATWTSPERSAQVIADTSGGEEPESPGVRRGEALWVKVSRSVKWLQPTDLLPRLVFPGGASQALQARVREDLEAVLSYYRDQYGIQADPDFTVYVAENVDALIQAHKDDGVEVDDAYETAERAQWDSVGNAGGWARVDERIVVKQSAWLDDPSTFEFAWTRSLLTHEYFHVLQHQLADNWSNWSIAWLVEGTAEWAEGGHGVTGDQQTWEERREGYQSGITHNSPTLHETEHRTVGWEYTLGWLAIDRLTAAHGVDSWLEFYRRLTATEIGPAGRWSSEPDWQAAFYEVFGLAVHEFYADFNAWQQEQVVNNSGRANSEGAVAQWIFGRVTDAAGSPAGRVTIIAQRVENEADIGWEASAGTTADGTFAVGVSQNGDYRLSVYMDDDCALYYSNGELIDDKEQAQLIEVTGVDLRGVDIQLPPNICGWQIRGRAVDSDGEPLAGAAVTACPLTSGNCSSERTESDGAFAVTVDKPGDYRLALGLGDGCRVYYGPAGLTSNPDDAALIHIGERDMRVGYRQIPADVCVYQIKGSITTSNGQPLTDTHVWACREVDIDCGGLLGRNTDADGTFAITVPVEGDYRLWFNLEGCTIYFRSGGLTTTLSERSTVRVEGRNVHLNPLQVPEGMCAQQISGRLVDSNNMPLSGVTIYICQLVDGRCEVWSGDSPTDDDGSFARTLSSGTYLLHIDFEGCRVYYQVNGLTTVGDETSPISVTEANSPNLRMRVPAEMCAQRISGRFVDAAGAAVANKGVRACGVPECGHIVYTAADGRFTIRVPRDGAYTFDTWLASDCYHRFGDRSLGGPSRPIRVSGADVAGIELRLPDTIENLCK